jgi:hypothetical protein
VRGLGSLSPVAQVATAVGSHRVLAAKKTVGVGVPGGKCSTSAFCSHSVHLQQLSVEFSVPFTGYS